MASRPGVVFPESMKDFLANPVQIQFETMPTDSDPTAFFVDSSAPVDSAASANSFPVGSVPVGQILHPKIIMPFAQQVGELSFSEKVPDLFIGTCPPMLSDLITGLDRINSTIAECIELSVALRETRSAQGPSRVTSSLRNSASEYST